MLARLALAVGGMTAVLLTPVFALSYFLAHGLPQESPPGCLALLREPLNEEPGPAPQLHPCRLHGLRHVTPRQGRLLRGALVEYGHGVGGV